MRKTAAIGIISIFFITLPIQRVLGAEKGVLNPKEAVVLFLKGAVETKGPSDDGWKVAKEGMTLSRNDSVKTGPNSWVEIGFGEDFKNVIRAKGGTYLNLDSLIPIKVGLLKGELRSLVEALSGDSSFQVRTPTAVCGARGTGWDTITDGLKVVVDTYEDEVFFSPLDESGRILGEEMIKAGSRGMLKSPALPISVEDIPPDMMREWSMWKEDFLKKLDINIKHIKEKVKMLRKTGRLKRAEKAGGKNEYDMSDDPRLKEARKSFEKGLRYLKRGDEVYFKKPGQAKKDYEHAEDYLLNAAFLYKKLGLEYDIDVEKEAATCEGLYRRVHVKVGKIRKKMMRR